MLFTRVKFAVPILFFLFLGACARSPYYTPYTGINTSKPLETVVSLSEAWIDLNGNIRVQLVKYSRYEQYYFSPYQQDAKPLGTYQVEAKELYAAKGYVGGWQVEGLSRGTIKINTEQNVISLDGILKKDSNNKIRLICLGCSPKQEFDGHKISNQVELNQTEGEIFKIVANYKSLEVENNKAIQQATANNQKLERLKIEKSAREGDGSPDDFKCKSFGFKFGSKDYGECRIKLEAIASQNIQQQRNDDIKKQQFDAQLAEQKRALDAQVDAQNKQRQLQAGQALLNYSQTLSNPAPALPANQTYIMPSGKMMNCTTTGATTSCF
jgi:hypothetical protein